MWSVTRHYHVCVCVLCAYLRAVEVPVTTLHCDRLKGLFVIQTICFNGIDRRLVVRCRRTTTVTPRVLHDHPSCLCCPDALSMVGASLSGNGCGSPNHI